MKIIAAPVDVIAKFSVKEKPVPIKFCYTDEVGKDKEIKVDKILEIEETKEVGLKTYIYHSQSKSRRNEAI